MAKKLTWDDAEDIGILLSETHPTLDPLAVRFTDLHRYVTELPEFAGDPKASNEGKLEAIQSLGIGRRAWQPLFRFGGRGRCYPRRGRPRPGTGPCAGRRCRCTNGCAPS